MDLDDFVELMEVFASDNWALFLSVYNLVYALIYSRGV